MGILPKPTTEETVAIVALGLFSMFGSTA